MNNINQPALRNLPGIIFTGLVTSFMIASCSKSGTTHTTPPVGPPPGAITNTIIPGGNIKGIMLSDSTYTINGDVTVLAADTLTILPGATIKVAMGKSFHVHGIINSLGSRAKPILFTSSASPQQVADWGGFQCDDAKAVTFRWTKIYYTGSPDATGLGLRTIHIVASIPFIFEDCWVRYASEDALRLEGGPQISVQRNTFDFIGASDAEAINVKTGTTGIIAYNVVWSTAGSAIKSETLTPLVPTTHVKIYNNTCVDIGYRRGYSEPGRGTLLDKFGGGDIFNNLYVNAYIGLDIAPDADTLHTTYGNNYFYSTLDSVRQYFYPAGSVGMTQTTDIISSGAANNDPMFVKYTTPPNINLLINPNDFHLKPGSPAIGKGNATYNNDIGAYTTSTDTLKSNQHTD